MPSITLPGFQCYVHSTNLSTSIFQHRLSMSFNMLNKQRSKYTNHVPVFISCHFFGNESQVQKVMLVSGLRLVNFDPCLFSVLEDDVRRCISNNSRYAHNTESKCNIVTQATEFYQRVSTRVYHSVIFTRSGRRATRFII